MSELRRRKVRTRQMTAQFGSGGNYSSPLERSLDVGVSVTTDSKAGTEITEVAQNRLTSTPTNRAHKSAKPVGDGRLETEIERLERQIRELNNKITELIAVSDSERDLVDKPTGIQKTGDRTLLNTVKFSEGTNEYRKVPKLRSFAGRTNRDNPREFLLAIERAKRQYDASDTLILQNWLPALLTGDAYRWFCMVTVSDWHSFKHRFQQRFISSTYLADLERDLYARTQADGEPLARYVAIITEMAREVMPECTIDNIFHFICRGANRYFAERLEQYYPKSLDEITEIAESLDTRRKQLRNRKPPPAADQMVHKDQGWFGTFSKYEKHYDEIDKHSLTGKYQPNDNSLFNGKCFRCGLNGHKSSSCNATFNDKQKQTFKRTETDGKFNGKCFKCGKHGHKSEKCKVGASVRQLRVDTKTIEGDNCSEN